MIEGITHNEKLACSLKEIVEGIIAEYNGRQVLLLFQGAGDYLAHVVLAHDKAISAPVSGWFDDEGKLDLGTICDCSKNVFNHISIADDVVVGVYEQIMPIRGSLSELYDGEIVVVRNNLFADKMPTSASSKYLSEFQKMLENPNHSSAEVDVASKFFADVFDAESFSLATPIQSADELGYATRNLFEFKEIKVLDSPSSLKRISAPGPVFTEFCMQLCEAKTSEICFEIDASLVRDNCCSEPQVSAVCSVLADCSVYCCVQAVSRFDTAESNEARLLPVLKKYWGPKADFRELSFYNDPSISKEMKKVSQGYIADQVVLQAEAAMNDSDSFKNVFVTAPTGAGKSVLFQVPALYLAENYNAVTVVVEPLIALMEDQVKGLRDRGVTNAVALNSNLSYSDRLSAIERIKRGELSLVYLSPELLLGSSLEEFIGDRPLGLMVIDEAHTVALWGKDFRSDYWFLGDYLSKLRRSGRRFPVFCLTATAVFGGADDIVYDVIEELELVSPKLFLGNVRRDDISFEIVRRDKKDYEGPIESVKYQLTVERIKDAIDAGKHILVYCPFRSHVGGVVDAFYSAYPSISRSTVMKFHGQLDKSYKDAALKQFKEGKCRVMVCTTAFGMGIDVDDIEEVIHFAPTGNLSNYIQEIGRGARRSGLAAIAAIDFFSSDSSYFARLYSMSSLRQKQLKEVMKKLYALYLSNKPKRQNLLIAPNSFSYLFGSDVVNKTKSALMMIAKDLQQTYGFPVLVVKSKPSYTKNYVCIPYSIDEEFNKKYGRYVKKVSKPVAKKLEMNPRNKWTSSIVVKATGDIYELESARMWEECFSNVTFNEFKWMLFSGKIIGSEEGDHPTSRFCLEIVYSMPFDQTCEMFNKYMAAIQKVLVTFKTAGRFFTVPQFKNEIIEQLGENASFTEFPEKVLDAFMVDPKHQNGTRSTIKCLQRTVEGAEARYRVAERSFVSIDRKFQKRLINSKPSEDGGFKVYLSRDAATNEELDLAILLELFDLATYKIRGGDDPELFVRLNDPNKINALANDPRYQNRILTDLNNRHKQSRSLITKFFLADMEDQQRWDIVESYFLGDGEEVEAILDASISSKVELPKKKANKQASGKGALEVELLTMDCNMDNVPFSKIWEYGKDDSDDEREKQCFDALSQLTETGEFEKPIYAPELNMPSTGLRISPTFAWPKSKVMLFLEEDAAGFDIAQESNWQCFMTGSSFEPEELVKAIGR